MQTHIELIQLIVGYTLTGALVFTVIVTCLSMVGWIKLANQAQQRKLFKILIVELVVVSVGFFAGLLNFDPHKVENRIREVEQFKALSNGMSKFVFSTEIIHEFLSNQWTTKTSMASSVSEYNDAITGLRTNEPSNLQLLQVYPDKTKAEQFKEIMELVNQIDVCIHSLNDELEKVSILGTQEKISPERATNVAGTIKPLLDALKAKTTTLLAFGGSK